MKLIDKRAIPLNTTFGDLAIGEAFQDCCDNLAVKTDFGMAMIWDKEKELWLPRYSFEEDEPIIPLEITYMVERKKEI